MDVTICTPAGRQRFLEILLPYLVRDHRRGLFSKWQLWLNTKDVNDLAWMKTQSKKYPFIERIEAGPLGVRGNSTIHQYYPYASNPDTVYIRLDDDVVYVHEDALTNLINFRLANPEYFLILGNVVNNAICSHIHQRLGILPVSRGVVGYNRKDARGWANGKYAIFVHEYFLKKIEEGTESDYFFPRWDLFGREIVSTNVCCWVGSDMMQCKIGTHEERAITRNWPIRLNRRCCIAGNTLFSHFSFYTQRKAISRTNLRMRYHGLMEKLTNEV